MQTPDNSGSRSSSRSSSPTKSPGSPVAPSRGMRALDSGFEPGMYDVICARGKHAKNHVGNRWFRSVVEAHMEEYSESETKLEKSFVVSKLIKRIRQSSPQGGFVKNFDGVWYEVGDRNAREKIGQTFRDLLHTQYRSSTKAKANLRQRKRASNSSGENSSRDKSPSEDTNDNSSSYDYSPSRDTAPSLEGIEVPAYQGFSQIPNTAALIDPIPISNSSFPADAAHSFPPLPIMSNVAPTRPLAGYHVPQPYQQHPNQQPTQHSNQHPNLLFQQHFPTTGMPSRGTMHTQFPTQGFPQIPHIPSTTHNNTSVFSNLEPLPFRENVDINELQAQTLNPGIQQMPQQQLPQPQQQQQQQPQHYTSFNAPNSRASIAPQTAAYAFDEMYEAYFAARLRPDAARNNNNSNNDRNINFADDGVSEDNPPGESHANQRS